MPTLKLLFLTFKTGIVAFGSGYVTIPFLYQNLVKTGILKDDFFKLLLAVSQISPGPIAINFLSLINLHLSGLLASVLALIAFLSFPLLGIIFFKIIWKKLPTNYQKKISLLMLPLVSTFLLWAIFSLQFTKMLRNNYFFYGVFGFLLLKTNLPLPYIMLGAGIWEIIQNLLTK
jgi:chromate transport protein ChrA